MASAVEVPQNDRWHIKVGELKTMLKVLSDLLHRVQSKKWVLLLSCEKCHYCLQGFVKLEGRGKRYMAIKNGKFCYYNTEHVSIFFIGIFLCDDSGL